MYLQRERQASLAAEEARAAAARAAAYQQQHEEEDARLEALYAPPLMPGLKFTELELEEATDSWSTLLGKGAFGAQTGQDRALLAAGQSVCDGRAAPRILCETIDAASTAAAEKLDGERRC